MIPFDSLFEQAVRCHPLYLFVPLLLSAAITAFILAVQWFAGLRSGRDKSFEKHKSISKGAPR